MKHKLIAIKLQQPQEWKELVESFPKRVGFFRETELQSVSKGKELSYLEKLIEIEAMMDTPSTANIMKLITDENFLIRKLPSISYSNGYFLENHMAQFELVCLVINIRSCWNKLNSEQTETLINFLIDKTDITLDSDADCFGISLKRTVDGLLVFQPPLEPRFRKIIAKREDQLKNR